jgi:hypothetical protein
LSANFSGGSGIWANGEEKILRCKRHGLLFNQPARLPLMQDIHESAGGLFSFFCVLPAYE